jgi:hypothetical protein
VSTASSQQEPFVTLLISRLRAPLIAIVVLALAAGAALAGGGPPPAADHGLDTARQASGQDVPMGAVPVAEGDEDADEPAAEEEQESEEPADEDAEEPGTEEAAGQCTDVDPTHHGSLVCWAAQNQPEGWTSGHGDWVSCVARLSNNGHTAEPEEGAEVEPTVWAEMTPEACDDALQAAREAKAAERDAAKAARAAAREAAGADRAAAKAAKGGSGKNRG